MKQKNKTLLWELCNDHSPHFSNPFIANRFQPRGCSLNIIIVYSANRYIVNTDEQYIDVSNSSACKNSNLMPS